MDPYHRRRQQQYVYKPRGRYAGLEGGNISYPHRIGTRRQVLHGYAHRTGGNLMRNNLVLNPRGHIVSRRAQAMVRRQNHLKGYLGWTPNNPLVRGGYITRPPPPARRRRFKFW